MMDKPKARLKITLKCDKACSYCINKCKEYRDRWKKVGGFWGQPDWTGFRSIVISGGEPTLDVRLRQVVCDLRIYTDGRVPIYLQTNGARLTKKLVQDIDGDIDGVGLSVHDMDEFTHMLTRWQDVLRVKPVRLYVDKGKWSDNCDLFDSLVKQGFGLRVWKEGESDPTEQIFLMED